MAAWEFGGYSNPYGGCSDLAATRFARLLDFQIRFFVRGFSFQDFDMILGCFCLPNMDFWVVGGCFSGG